MLTLNTQYDTQGHVKSQTTPMGGSFAFAYTEDANGNIQQTQVTDSLNIQRTLNFSASGYYTGGQVQTDIRAVGKPEQQTFTYAWQPSTNLLQSITDPLNRTTAYTYDSNGNKTGTTLLSGTSGSVTATAAYSGALNQVSSITDPMNRSVSFTYDAFGNLITVTKPLVSQVVNDYNANGQLVSSSMQGIPSVKVQYSAGLPSALMDGLGDTVSTVADAAGRTVSTSDALGHTSQYQYDNDNHILSTTDALLNKTQLSYDQNGNVLTLADANGGTLTYTYDSANRVQTRQDALGAIAHFYYDTNGNLTSVTDRKNQTKTFTYDSLNRLTRFTYSDQSNTSYTYDAGNRLTQTVDSIAGTTTYTYDLLNRLLSKTNPLGSVSYTYNAAGQRTSMTVAGQMVVNYSYDAAGRIYQITQGTAAVTIGYDTVGRRSSLILPNGVTTAYHYDGASRLSEIDYSNSSGSLGNLTYQCDAAGHRTAMGGSLARVTLPTAFSGATYNAANQLVKRGGVNFAYDSLGNLTGDGTSTYNWNVRNQLASISGTAATASFGYDASGKRVAATVNTVPQQFQFDGANVVQEFNGLGSVTANLLTGLGLDENYSRTDISGTQSYLTDALNSTVALTDGGGNSSSQYTFDPAGGTTQTGAASTNAFQFTGRQNDGTGLYYMRARYYSPALGRFISEDPIGVAGGTTLYAYSGNNPTNLSDPLGTNPKGAPQQGNNNPFLAAATIFRNLAPDFLAEERSIMSEMGASVISPGSEGFTD
jgi:RHS repeat-associated protein